jgi:hypothetical protein
MENQKREKFLQPAEILGDSSAKEEQNSRQKAEAKNRKQGKAPARKIFAK